MLQGICSKYSSHRLFARYHSQCGFVRISSVFRVKVTSSSKQCLFQEEKPSDLKLLICSVATSTEEYPARNMVKKTGFPLGKRFNMSHEGLNRALGGWQSVPMGWREAEHGSPCQACLKQSHLVSRHPVSFCLREDTDRWPRGSEEHTL